ncbi:TldD/PmbA family protein [Candidatus Bealeia paramacronuclearis]
MKKELEYLIEKAKSSGAEACDVVGSRSSSLSVTTHKEKREKVERSESLDVGLRVLIGKRQASVSTSDLSHVSLDQLVERALSMAKIMPEDPFCGLASKDQLAIHVPDLSTYDFHEPTPDELGEMARIAESAALAVKGVTNSERGEASWGTFETYLLTSEGFENKKTRSSFGVSTAVIAQKGESMEVDYDYSSAVFVSDLKNPADVGKSAGEKTVARLNPRKIKTGEYPVIFDRRMASTLLSHLAQGINGVSIANGTSFLKDKLGSQVFGSSIQIVDDPLRLKGFGSRAFDGEGLPTQRRAIIENGVLQTWFLNLRTARQLGLASTGHAVRSGANPPAIAASNFYLEPGLLSPEALYKEAGSGILVTSIMGMGFNDTTGDYSVGASGFWIENGELTYPVSEITIASNILEMFKTLTPANDVVFESSIVSPTVRIEKMMVAGA